MSVLSELKAFPSVPPQHPVGYQDHKTLWIHFQSPQCTTLHVWHYKTRSWQIYYIYSKKNLCDCVTWKTNSETFLRAIYTLAVGLLPSVLPFVFDPHLNLTSRRLFYLAGSHVFCLLNIREAIPQYPVSFFSWFTRPLPHSLQKISRGVSQLATDALRLTCALALFIPRVSVLIDADINWTASASSLSSASINVRRVLTVTTAFVMFAIAFLAVVVGKFSLSFDVLIVHFNGIIS